MKKSIRVLVSMALVLAMLTAAIPAFADTALQGTVLSVTPTDLMLGLGNGTVLTFKLNNLPAPGVNVGDEILVEYTGDVLSAPVATKIALAQPDAADKMTGTVLSVTGNVVFLQISTTTAFGFKYDAKTTYSFVGMPTNPPVAAGDTVTVTFTGDPAASAYATNFEVKTFGAGRGTAPAAPAPASGSSSSDADQSLIDKTLNGTVTELTSKKMTIRTSKGKSYTFKRVKSTQYTGKYKLETGATVKVRYDGYASKRPDAKEIKVTAAAPKVTPTPKPKVITPEPAVELHTFTGEVIEWNSNKKELWMEGGLFADCSNAKIYNREYAIPGMLCKITYYWDETRGKDIATKVTFNP